MTGIQGKWLAGGIAIAISLAAFHADACKLHTMTLNGLQTGHPASVSVSLATRRAVDNGQISGLPRATRQQRLDAIADVEAVFLSAVVSLRHSGFLQAPVFSLYLTESAHWIRFIPNASGWTVHLHQADAAGSEIVFIVSDTAMRGLLIDELTIADAQALGVLVATGDPPGRELALASIAEWLDGTGPRGTELAVR
jgi:hypothetical protein